MKHLQLDLQKRILIVELPRLADYEFINRETKYLKVGNEEINLNISTLSKMEIVCKGDELTEEIAQSFSVHVKSSHNEDGFIHYKCEQDNIVYSPAFVTALDSFTSAIEAKGWYFGDNPEKKSNFNPEKFIQEEYERFMEAESKTFHPQQCLILEEIV